MHAISPTREEDFPNWYQEVIKPLAQHGAVRGTQVLKPWGYGIWERIQYLLDQEIKVRGHENMYAPLFVGLDAIEQEAAHIEGFAKECAVVTHSRLVKGEDGGLVPDGKLPMPVIVRPTSEAIIGPIVKDWIMSYRDLPLKLNQWANVVRWEMRTRLFLRSSEFLWQEGHTFHASAVEAKQHALDMLSCYEQFFQNVLALSPCVGEKSELERFAGAEATYTLELLMQDGKALQGGTSHYLGESFSKAYDIQFTDQGGKIQLAKSTSWGLTTRLIGAVVMTHGDNDGLKLPPIIAPSQVIIIPINPKGEERVNNACAEVKAKLESMMFSGEKIRVKIDDREMRGGDKSWEWIKKGAPIRLEIGPKDLDNDSVSVKRRDASHKERISIKMDNIQAVGEILQSIQDNLYQHALVSRQKETYAVTTKDELKAHFKEKGGFVKIPYAGGKEEEEAMAKWKVSIRCLLPSEAGICGFTGKKTSQVAVIAKAY